MIDTGAVANALACARAYYALGFQPLPSRSWVKSPAMESYAQYWEERIPESVFDGWTARNVQVMCGAKWRLCVVDCDGDEAKQVWRSMRTANGGHGRTWTCATGGGGVHYWFRLPDWLDEFPGRRLWGLWDTYGGEKHAGDWSKHKEIRLLGDRSLVVAPPSVHPTSGVAYAWRPTLGPSRLSGPAQAPDWLIRMPGVETPGAKTPARRAMAWPAKREHLSSDYYDRNGVLDAIHDKVSVVRNWGLRIASRQANPNGWLKCYAIDREDQSPSASFSERGGQYWDGRSGQHMSMFDLGVELGVFRDWREALRSLGKQFVG